MKAFGPGKYGAEIFERPIGPRRFEFAVNLKTAKALGLTIAPELLYQASHIVR